MRREWKSGESMKLLDMVYQGGEIPEKPVISLVGAGGKTTCAFVLAEELAAQGKKVLVTTTTHMENPCFFGRNGVLDGVPEHILAAKCQEHVVVAGLAGPGGEKMKALPEGVLEAVLPEFDGVIIEADGSRRHPFKVPAAYEPVIVKQSTHILVVAGAPALGKPLEEVCFRLEEAEKILTACEAYAGKDAVLNRMILTPELAGLLLEEGYVKPLGRKYPGRVLRVLLNQSEEGEDTACLRRHLSVPLCTRPSGGISAKPHFHLHMLAAGLSRRFGSNKLLCSMWGKPMYTYLTDSLKTLSEERQDVASVTVVSRYKEILEEAKKAGFIPVENLQSEKGISVSVRMAVESIPGIHRRGEVHYHCFFVSDQPHLREETVSRFLDGFLRSQKGIGCLAGRNTGGNPVVFHEKYRDELCALTGDTGGKAVMKRHPEDVYMCRIEDERELRDYDYPVEN